MDAFYLKNAALYEKLVAALDVTKPVPHFSRFTAGSHQKKTVDENFNSDIVVSARVRPMLDEDLSAGFPCAMYPRPTTDPGGRVVDVHDLYNHPMGRLVLKSFKYQLDNLYDSTATTEEIYNNLVGDLVSLAENGGVATLFAYGQTGSGKTFTIDELQKRAVAAIVSNQGSMRTKTVSLTIVELSGNSACDLLDARKAVPILEDAQGVTHLTNAMEHHINDQQQVLDLLEQATSLRRTASTMKNNASSRSHCICRFRISDSTTKDADGLLYFVDLAGSEAGRDYANHSAERIQETKEINRSLSVLKDCIREKANADGLKAAGRNMEAKKVYLPVRHSTLTKVLKHVFDPNGNQQSKTVVIACVNPSLADVSSSNNTLRYAVMLRKTAPTIN